MKRLVAFDFDATLMDSPVPETGRGIWREKTGEDYPHIGWWGRKESLSLNVFDIQPFPDVLAKLNEEKSIEGTSVVILTSRMEKLRPEVEAIMNKHGIVVDDILLKKGGAGKGEVLLNIVQYNPDLEEIIIYDDYMNGNAEKIAEYTEIADKLPKNINYVLNYVESGRIRPLKSGGIVNFDETKKLLDIIQEEISKFI